MLARLQAAGAMPGELDEIAQYRTATSRRGRSWRAKSAMEYMWSNQLVAVWTAAGDSATSSSTRCRDRRAAQSENYLKPSQFISITAHQAPEKPAMFIDFITNDVDANKILLGERGVPISPTIPEAIKPLLTPAQVEAQNYLGMVDKDSSPLPPPDPSAQQNWRTTSICRS